MFKSRLPIIVAVVMLLSLLPAQVAYADTEGGVSGSFQTGNVAPTVGTIIAPASMTPQAEWTTITVPVTDSNTLADVNEVKVKLFHDTVSGDPDESGYTADGVNCAVLTWTRSGSLWAIGQGTCTTWDIDEAGCEAGTDAETTDNWVFSFKVGKVATESPGTTDDDWDIYVKATDAAPESGYAYLRDKEMNWYGGISTPNPATAEWGTVTPGLDFAEDTQEKGPISIIYIANGDYDQKVKTTNTWTGDPSGTATLDPSGNCINANQFALKADDAITITNAVLVDTSGISIDNSGTQTGETGDTEANNTLWLKLASVFSHATYSGTITFTIENR